MHPKPIQQTISGLICKHRLSQLPDAPLVVLVHGRAGNVDLMWTFSRCIPEDHSIVSVQAPLPDPLGGFSWWTLWEERSPDEKRELTRTAADTLDRFITTFKHSHALTPSYLLGIGFSQGAGLLSLLMQLQPTLFSGVALLAGFVLKAEGITRISGPKIFMAHGSKDKTIPIESALRAAQYLGEIGLTVEFYQDEVEHKIGTTGTRELKRWVHEFHHPGSTQNN